MYRGGLDFSPRPRPDHPPTAHRHRPSPAPPFPWCRNSAKGAPILPLRPTDILTIFSRNIGLRTRLAPPGTPAPKRPQSPTRGPGTQSHPEAPPHPQTTHANHSGILSHPRDPHTRPLPPSLARACARRVSKGPPKVPLLSRKSCHTPTPPRSTTTHGNPCQKAQKARFGRASAKVGDLPHLAETRGKTTAKRPSPRAPIYADQTKHTGVSARPRSITPRQPSASDSWAPGDCDGTDS